jgi:hypothetical protein
VIRSLLFLLILTVAARAQEQPKAGQVYQSVQVDLNGDGKPEKVGLIAYGHAPVGFFGRLTVWDSGGKVWWRAPVAKTPDDPFAFGQWEYGSSSLEWVGAQELISAKPQSDVRPTTFRRFSWTGSAYRPLANQYLLATSEDSFNWSRPFQWDGVKPLTWVSSLNQQLAGEVLAYRSGGMTQTGSAQLQAAPTGMKVVRWLRALANQAAPAPLSLEIAATPADRCWSQCISPERGKWRKRVHGLRSY